LTSRTGDLLSRLDARPRAISHSDQGQPGAELAAHGPGFENFAAASYAELQERHPPGSRERHLLAEFLGFSESAGVLVSRRGAGVAAADLPSRREANLNILRGIVSEQDTPAAA
jgi:hypothetical protein